MYVCVLTYVRMYVHDTVRIHLYMWAAYLNISPYMAIVSVGVLLEQPLPFQASSGHVPQFTGQGIALFPYMHHCKGKISLCLLSPV